jgi:hypothetical protein
MRIFRIGAIAVASLLALLQSLTASAAQYRYTVTGITSTDVTTGFYGQADPTFAAGLNFTITFTLDDSLASALYSDNGLLSSASGGGQIQEGTRPPLSASIQIGSFSYTVRQGTFTQPYHVDETTGDASGVSIQELDGGTLTKNSSTGYLSLYTGFSRTESCCGTFFGYTGSDIDLLDVYLRSDAFTSGSFTETGSFALDPQSSGNFLVGSVALDRNSTTAYYSAAIGLAATQLTVTAVPEPEQGALLIAGLVLLAAVRRVKQVRANAQRPNPLLDLIDAKNSPHYWHHRPGRGLPRRAAAFEKGYISPRREAPRSSSFNTGRVEHLYQDPHEEDRPRWSSCTTAIMTDATNLIRIVQEVQPDEIYNLAAP